jgi:tetratricopeptide (TPR) repeat protein
MAENPSDSDAIKISFWVTIGILSAVWIAIAGWSCPVRALALAWLSLASFMVGCLVGFLFSSYGEESNTLGKVRDWLIGAITTFTLVKVSAIRGLVGIFATGSDPIERAYAIAASVFYVGLGFLFMFFQRELILNVLLARSRAERGRLDGTVRAGQVTQQFLLTLPPSILSGASDIEDVVQFDQAEAKHLKEILEGDEVEKFLEAAEQAAKSATLDWDVISKAANLHYYRTYFKKDGEKRTQAIRAHEWIMRALAINPLHVEFTVKLADVLGTLERYQEAITLMERLSEQPEGPAYVAQWLGYFYLFVDKEDMAIKYCKAYLEKFPEDADSLINLACAYGQKFCKEVHAGRAAGPAAQQDRKDALGILKRALQRLPDYAEMVRTKLTEPDESFFCLRDDQAFKEIVGLEKPESTGDSQKKPVE